MIKTIYFLIVFTFISLEGWSQNNGFIGKKNFIAIDLRAYTPIVHGLRTKNQINFKTRGSDYANKKNLVDYGFNFSIGRVLSRNVGVILQYARSNFDFILTGDYRSPIVSNDTYEHAYRVVKANFFEARSVGIMPILELNNSSGLLPLGLSHQFGIGFNKSYFVEKDYHLRYEDFEDGTGITEAPLELYNFKNDPITSYTMMYKINLRIPISKSILFNFGIRYNFNYFPEKDISSSAYANQFLLTRDNLIDIIKSKESKNFICFETGFNLCF
jgi:hypothetical protein